MSIPLLSSLSQRAAQRAKTAARKARRKAKAAMIGTRKRRKVIRISTYDAQWSKLVRERDGHTCRKPGCGKRAPANVMHAHHIIGRGKKSTRLLIENGLTLCVHHHVWGDDSAHKVGKQFCIDIIGQAEYDRLHGLSLIHKPERKAIEEFILRHVEKAA